MTLKNLDEKGTPIICLASSNTEIPALVGFSKTLSKNDEFVLLLKDDERLVERLLPAYLNSSLRSMESNLKSKDASMETLLFAAGTLRTEKAIKEAGASDKSRFIVFATNRKVFSRFAKKARIKIVKEYKPSLDMKVAGEVASIALLED